MIRLPPLGLIGLMGSARSLTGHVTICCVGINGGFSRRGNIFRARRLQDFLGTLDFLSCVAMRGEENSTLLQAAFLSLCFELRDPHADQGPGNSSYCSPNAKSGQSRHNRASRDKWAQAGDCK